MRHHKARDCAVITGVGYVSLFGAYIVPPGGSRCRHQGVGLCALIRGVDTAVIRGRALCPY